MLLSSQPHSCLRPFQSHRISCQASLSLSLALPCRGMATTSYYNGQSQMIFYVRVVVSWLYAAGEKLFVLDQAGKKERSGDILESLGT